MTDDLEKRLSFLKLGKKREREVFDAFTYIGLQRHPETNIPIAVYSCKKCNDAVDNRLTHYFKCYIIGKQK